MIQQASELTLVVDTQPAAPGLSALGRVLVIVDAGPRALASNMV
jgi:hypothetical protein